MRIPLLKHVLLSFLLSLIISCQKVPENHYYNSFDKPLFDKNLALRIQGDYKGIIELNQKYYHTATSIYYPEGQAHCYLNMAIVNITIGNYKDALFLLKKADHILENSDHQFLKALLYQEYGLLYFSLQLYDKANDYNNKAIVLYKKDSNRGSLYPSKQYLMRAYMDRADFFNQSEKKDSSLYYYHKARLFNPRYAYLEGLIAQYHLKNTQPIDSATFYIKNALQLASEQPGIHPTQIDVNFAAGNYYTATGNYQKAEEAYKKAIEVDSITKNVTRFFSPRLYKALVDFYAKTNNPDKKYLYLEKYNNIKNDLENNEKATVNIAIKQFIDEIKTAEKQKENKIWLFSILIALLLISVTVYSYLQIKSLKQKEKVLGKKTIQLEDEVKNKKFYEIMELAKKNDSSLLVKFHELYPNFTDDLLKINPNMENSELVFCAMLKLNFSSKEISNIMFIQHKSVQQRKRRLRMRLNIPSDVDIYQFLHTIGK